MKHWNTLRWRITLENPFKLLYSLCLCGCVFRWNSRFLSLHEYYHSKQEPIVPDILQSRTYPHSE